MLTFLTSKIWHHAHSMVTSSHTNSKGTHAAYEDVLFHENDKLQTEKMDKNERWTTFTSFLYVANCDSNVRSIGVTLGLLLYALHCCDFFFRQECGSENAYQTLTCFMYHTKWQNYLLMPHIVTPLINQAKLSKTSTATCSLLFAKIREM